MRKAIVSIFIPAISFIFMSSSYAVDSATTTISLTVTVPPVVTVIAGTLDFGSLSQTEFKNSETIITVNASGGTIYHIALDAGLHSAPGTTRKVEYAGNYIAYWIYKDAAHTYEWGDAGGGYDNTYVNGDPTGPFTGNDNNQSHAVYGKISAIGSTPVGTYIDTVTVTVHY